jgi:serine/threonine protein kinase
MSTDPTAPHVESSRPGFQDALQRLCFSDEEFARKYEGWEEIGRGGFAVVVKTFCRDYGHPIAVKVFSQLDEEQLARFRQEVHNARLFHSRNVVKTFGATIRGTLAWIEMEYLDGPNLRKELERRHAERRPFSIDEAVGIGIAVSEALAAGHAADVLHRDVKPANILLPKSGDVVAKLGDFGVSRFSGHAKVTKTGCSPGTPQFWAPEVCNGRPPIAPSDVYSFSVCLYMLLSGNNYPYNIPEDAVVTTYQEAHRHQAPIPITVFNGAVPRPLQEILTLGMAKEPEHRPSIQELHDALIAAGATKPRTSLTAESQPRARATRRRLVVASIGGGLLVAATLFALVRPREMHRAPATPAEVPSEGAVRPSAAGQDGTAHVPTASSGATLPSNSFHASMDALAATVTNQSTSSVTVRQIAIMPEGEQPSTASSAVTLAPGESLMIPLEEFTPPLARGVRPRSLRVVTGTDTLEVTIAAP